MRDSTKKYQQYIGREFGRLKVISLFRNIDQKNELYYHCECSCGNKDILIRAYCVISGSSKSCGCFLSEERGKSSIKHGLTKHPLFNIWNAMMQRCYNSKHKHYKHYGGRGITVCENWHNPKNFIDDMSPRPNNLELDRFPDNNGNYEPENCRWATEKQQMNNFRRNRWIEFNGERRTLTDWARKIGIKENTLIYRLDIVKWSLEKALTTPKMTNKIDNINNSKN